MRVLLDRVKCQGYGNCALAAPGIFDVDDSGLVVLLVDDLPEDRGVEIKQAVRDCPTDALALEE